MARRYSLLVVAATLAGAGLRLWQLTAVPPGLHYDLAATALLGNEVAFHGYRPLFIPAYTGHEALFYYWLAVWFNLIGSSVFSLRLAAALLGVLTIPATFFAVREVLHGEAEAYPAAAFAAVLLADAFFHVTFSRFGFRAISEPLVQCLALGFTFRGLRGLAQPEARPWYRAPRTWHLALGGAFTGLAAYTYLSARLFPFPLGVFWLALLIGAWRQPLARRGVGLAFGIFFAAAAAVFAPLGVYFWQHPEDFLNRAGQVVARPGEQALLWAGVRAAAEMLFLKGEPYDRFNLPGLPLFAFPLGVFFIIGLLLTSAALVRRSSSVMQRAGALLLLVWLPFMLLPTALSVHDIFPSNVRAFGLTPLVFVFPARGLLAAYRWLQRRWPGPLLPTAYPVTVVGLLLLAAGTFNTYHDYFDTWAQLPAQRLNNDADLTGIAAYLNQHALGTATPYVSSIHYRHPTLAYLARDFPAIQWLTGGRSLVIPPTGGALYLFAASAPLPEEWLAGWGPHLTYQQLGPDNHAEFRAFQFASGETPPLPAFTPLSENFANQLTLTGYRLQPDGANLNVDLRWRVENPAEAGDLLPYARLYDAAGRVWAQSGDFTYPSEQWRPGDTVLTRQIIPLPLGLPAGDYTVKAGWFSQSTQTDLAHLNGQGGFGGERAELGMVTLVGGPAVSLEAFRAAIPAARPSQMTGFAGDLQLLGYQLLQPTPRPNERFELTLFWYARAPVTAPVRITLGGQVLLDDRLRVNQALTARYRLRVPLAAAPGAAELRVSVPDIGEALLTPLSIRANTPAFTPPATAVQLGAASSAGIALAGYTLIPGATTQLELVFRQAGAASLEQDYTVFVHVLDAAGQTVAQVDTPPRGGDYPTSLWAPGEYVTDAYHFTLTPGAYTLDVGVYTAETGARLLFAAPPNGQPVDQIRLPGFRVP